MEASLSFWFDVKYSKNKRNGTEELVFIDEWSVLSIVLGDHGRNSFVEDKKWAGHTILLHEVLSFVDFAESKFFQKNLFDFFILDERGEGEMMF